LPIVGVVKNFSANLLIIFDNAVSTNGNIADDFAA